MSAGGSKNWFAFYTKPHKEYVVRDFLSWQGIETYLPEIGIPARRPDHSRAKRPFFPHYLFARLDLQDGTMANVRWTPGLRYIVSLGDRPVPISDETMACLRQRVATLAEEEPTGPFKQGERVRVLHGPFEGLDAVFDRRLSPEGRVRVFLDWMSRQVAAELDMRDLSPLY
jgi:transcriptional antiterminator RfaH